MDWLPRDTALRAAAFAEVVRLQRLYADAIPWSAIAQGFVFEGKAHPLSSKAEGIYAPAGHPAALSIKTTVPRKNRDTNPYVDELRSDERLMRYAYKEKGGSDNAANRSLRWAQAHRLPLIYFWGVAEARYAALLPVYVEADLADERAFGIVPGELLATANSGTHVHALFEARAPDRRYAAREVRVRLHQQAFRVQVLDAYEHHCAMCSIKFDEFLEAAHILPDKHERGAPVVNNGLALCTLHHGAFDRHLIDVSDDYRIVLHPELARRRDGNIFQAAFLERDGQLLHLPRRVEHHPSPVFLRERRRLAS